MSHAEDDPSIPDSAPLWRRIHPKQLHFDPNLGVWRPSSAAFKNHQDGSGMSVVLGDEVLEAGRTVDSVMAGHDGFSLAWFSAALARELEQGVVRRPLENEPAHAEVVGEKPKRVQRAFAANCQWLIPPHTNPTS